MLRHCHKPNPPIFFDNILTEGALKEMPLGYSPYSAIFFSCKVQLTLPGKFMSRYDAE